MPDNIIDNKFSSNYASMPSRIKFFLSSNTNGEVIIKLAKKYKLDSDKVYSLAFLVVNSDFDLKLTKRKVLLLDLTGISLDNFWLDFLTWFLLPISLDIKNYTDGKVDIEQEIKKLGGNVIDGQEYLRSFEAEVQKEEDEVVAQKISEFEEDFDIDNSTNDVLNLLSTSVVEILTSDSFQASNSLNFNIIYLLLKDKGFKDKALKSLFSSKEMIGKNYIIIDDRQVEPTISNWFKDFIKQNGSDYFDDLLLINYINKSDNAKNLRAKEKKVLANLFKFYRNLSFFPESLENVDPDNWKIFPFKNPKDKEGIDDVLSEEKGKVIKNKDIVTEKKPLSEEVKASEKESEEILALRELLKLHSPSSLESKAINQEIRKLIKLQAK